MTNSDLLLHYGFVLPDNIYESVGFNFQLEKDSPQYDIKVKILEKYGLKSDIFEVNVPLTGRPTETFIACLRIKNHMFTYEENQKFLSSPSVLPEIDPMKPISAVNEFEVYHGLLVNAEQLLNMYPTTLDEDIKLLRQSESEVKRIPKIAIVLRIELKRILKATILECLQGIKRSFDLVSQQHNQEQSINGDQFPSII